jgi:hypothetical protein
MLGWPRRDAVIYGLDELKRIEWSKLRTANGFAEEVPSSLSGLLASTDMESALEAYWRLDNEIVVQRTLYEVAEFVVPILLSKVQSASDLAKERILDLLVQLAAGTTSRSEEALGNFNIEIRCRSQMRYGIAIFYHLLEHQSSSIRNISLEILELIEEDTRRLSWFLNQIIKNDPNDHVREIAISILQSMP